MGPQMLTLDKLLEYAKEALEQRRIVAEELLERSAMTREQLIKDGLLSDSDLN